MLTEKDQYFVYWFNDILNRMFDYYPKVLVFGLRVNAPKETTITADQRLTSLMFKQFGQTLRDEAAARRLPIEQFPDLGYVWRRLSTDGKDTFDITIAINAEFATSLGEVDEEGSLSNIMVISFGTVLAVAGLIDHGGCLKESLFEFNTTNLLGIERPEVICRKD